MTDARQREVGELAWRVVERVRGDDSGQAISVTLAEVLAAYITELTSPRPLADWHEGDGAVLWWRLPVREPPYVGRPGDRNWPDYHTHWTPFPMPFGPEAK